MTGLGRGINFYTATNVTEGLFQFAPLERLLTFHMGRRITKSANFVMNMIGWANQLLEDQLGMERAIAGVLKLD